MKYQFIAMHQDEHCVTRMCRVLGVARSGYYGWRTEPSSQRERTDLALAEHIQAIFQESQQTYGSRRVRAALCQRNMCIGRSRVRRLMRQTGLIVLRKRRRVGITRAKADVPSGENKLARNFTAQKPNQKWLVDITQVATDEGKLYLAAVLDLFSRKIVGWAMHNNLRDELTQAALRMAL